MAFSIPQTREAIPFFARLRGSHTAQRTAARETLQRLESTGAGKWAEDIAMLRHIDNRLTEDIQWCDDMTETALKRLAANET